MENEVVIALPPTLQALYELFADPRVAAVFFSMLLEQTPFIKDPKVENWKKVLVVVIVGIFWSVGVALFSPTGFALSAPAVYAVLVAGFGLAFGMTIWNKLVDQGLPWLRDLLITLFGRKVMAG
jgi:hypothetical protein